MYALCVPTYGRKRPKILDMLKADRNITINFFVRGEDYDSSFYDELKTIERVNVYSLGYGLHEIGETRQRIVEWCRSNNIEFCFMFDDGVTNLVNTVNSCKTITEIMEDVVNYMQRDPLKRKLVGWSFHKRFGEYSNGNKVLWDDSHVKNERYFLTLPVQAIVINIKMMFKHNLVYKSLDEVGLEDCAFFADCVKKGLIFGARKYLVIDGVVPNETKSGGNHTKSESLEKKYDTQNRRCLKYIGPMMGVYLEKRYRSYTNGLLSYVIFDTDYYREVLCDKPEKNKKIIQDHFMFDYKGEEE